MKLARLQIPALLVVLTCSASSASATFLRGEKACYVEREVGNVVFVLDVKFDGSLTTFRDVRNGALSQITYSAVGKWVTDTDFQSTDGGVIVGGDDEGAYMDLHAYKLSAKCASDQASPTPATWTCSLATDGGTETGPVRFDRVASKDNSLCTNFVIPDIPDANIPTPAPPPPSGSPTPPDNQLPDIATCSQCTGLACLLSAGTAKQCTGGENLCVTTVDDTTTSGRQITRGCADSDMVSPVEEPSAECKQVEAKIIDQECKFYCDGTKASGCNAPPALIPSRERVPAW